MYDWWVSSDTFLTAEHAAHNALNLFAFLRQYGWTTEAIAGAAGNFEIECHFNPGYFQNHRYHEWPTLEQARKFTGGFGLAQWTPADKYFSLSIVPYPNADYKNGWAQAYRFTKTRDQWSVRLSGMTFQTYISTSDKTPEQMADLWCKGYENPGSPDKAARRENARKYYDLFLSTPVEDLPEVPENPIYPGDPGPQPPDPPGPEPVVKHIPIWLLFKMRNKRRF